MNQHGNHEPETALRDVALCPNHHRFATLIQQMLDSSQPRHEIEAFARQHFDLDFNDKLLDKLLEHSYHLSETLADSLDLLVDAPDVE